MNLKTALREELLQYRGKNSVSQEKIAEQCNISSRYYRKLERADANPSLVVLAELRRVCGLDLNQLVDQMIHEE